MQSSHRLLSRLLHSTKRNAVLNPPLIYNPLLQTDRHGPSVPAPSPLLNFTPDSGGGGQKENSNKSVVGSNFKHLRRFSSVQESKRFAFCFENNDARYQYSSNRSKWVVFFFW